MPYDPTPVLHTLPGGGTATANVYVLPPSEAGPIEIAAGVAREIDVPFFRDLRAGVEQEFGDTGTDA